ncbi:hypothetical protein ACJX0J_014872 [Zea mays]
MHYKLKEKYTQNENKRGQHEGGVLFLHIIALDISSAMDFLYPNGKKKTELSDLHKRYRKKDQTGA